METPEEIKKGLREAPHVKYLADDPSSADGRDVRYGVVIGYVLREEIVALIERLEQAEEALAFESTYREDQAVSWELKCSLLEREAAQAERERDAAGLTCAELAAWIVSIARTICRLVKAGALTIAIAKHARKSALAAHAGITAAGRGEAFARRTAMHNTCSPLDCKVYAAGWCEYDAITGVLYPMDPDNCRILKEDGHNAALEPERIYGGGAPERGGAWLVGEGAK